MNIHWKFLRSWQAVVLLLAVTGGSCLFHLWAVNILMPGSYSDLLPRIVGTRDALKGMNPYSKAVLDDIQTAQYGHPLAPGDIHDPQNFDYPALIVPVLAPFAHFSWPAIRAGFLWLMVPAFGICCLVWLRVVQPSPPALMSVLVTGLALFAWPTMWGFRLQQPTIALFVVLTLAVYWLRRGWDRPAGACMALALIKPQIGLPVMLWLMVWAVRHRRWQLPAGFVLSFSSLWIVADWMVPGWFGKWVGSMGAYTALTAPISETVFGKAGGLVVAGLLGGWSVWLLWGMLGFDSDEAGFGRALALGIAACVFITPNDPALIYNQVLLLPAILWILFSELERPVSVLARVFTIGLLLWNYLAVAVAAGIEVLEPKSITGYLLPILDQFLSIVVLISLLVISEQSGWARCGIWKRVRRGLSSLSSQ